MKVTKEVRWHCRLNQAKECPACNRCVVYLTYEENGHEWIEPVSCRRCNA
jgi:hypothetical protein